jgi:hypothetical protein
MDSKKECDIALGYMECENHGGKKETWKAKEEMVT